MKKVWTLVLMQLRDKMNLSWVRSFKDTIHVVILAIVKFVVLTALFTGILYGLSLLKLVYHGDLPSIMTLVLSFVFILLLISCTTGLTKSLYFSEDNKVLITLPVTNNKIFISKLLVFLFYELKRSFSFTIPIILGCAINIYLQDALDGISFLWMILPLLLYVILPVLLGGLLSIPAMYIYIFVSKHNWSKIVLILAGLGLYIFAILSITKYLPAEINMNKQWPEIRLAVVKFLERFETLNPVGTQITRILIGEGNSLMVYKITWLTVGKFAIMLACCIVLFLGCYFISRPFFYKMMSKNFEFNKNNKKAKSNKKHSKFVAFNIKEMKVTFRTLEVSINYALVYITIPILIFILDELFMAQQKSPQGTYISYAFNILLIIFPLLMSNSLIATYYSKEGRAGYIKKTKPVNPLMPLLAKLSFNLIFCIPSIIASVCIFSRYVDVCALTDLEKYSKIGAGTSIIFFLAILLLNYAHIFMCATSDLMNPQNEVYATSGNDISNANEMRGTASAVVISFIYALLAFILFNEGTESKYSLLPISIKLLVLSLILAVYFIGKFVLSIKTCYAPNKE